MYYIQVSFYNEILYKQNFLLKLFQPGKGIINFLASSKF